MYDYYLYINGRGVTLTEAKILVLNLYYFTQIEMSIFLKKTESTMKTYVKNLNAKLDVHCPTQMYQFSIKHGFDELGNFNGIEIIPKIEIATFRDKHCTCANCFDGFCLIHCVGLKTSNKPN